MKILVTGGSGFIGRAVVSSMVRRGHEVVSPAGPTSDPVHCLDLFDSIAVEDYLKIHRPEGLVHLAWDATPGRYWNSSANLTWVAASLRLLESFERNGGKRAVVVGTSAEYSWETEGLLSEVDTPLLPKTLYGISKVSLYRILSAWAPLSDLSFGWGRVFCPYGPFEKPSRLIPSLISRLKSGEIIEFDSGRLIRDFLHVDELADGLVALFESSYVGAVNVGSGEDMRIRDLLTSLGEILGRSQQIRFDKIPDPEGQPYRIVASTEILESVVGWAPSKTNLERLKETCDWWEKRGAR